MGKTRKRTAGSGSIIARPNGTFTAQITTVERRRSIGTFSSRLEAERAIAAAIVEGPPPAIDTSLGAYLTAWLEDQELAVKATTAARNRTCIRAWVLPHRIARRRIRDLRPDDFRTLYRELADHGRADGGPLAPASLATLDRVLKSALQRLVDDRELRWHPIPRRIVSVPRTERPWLRVDQVRELIRFARFADPDLEVVVRLGALAGLRRGEICGLRWTDVDLDGASITVRRSRTVAAGHVGESEPKTSGSRASLALDADTVAALLRHRQRREKLIEQEPAAREYVICTAAGAGMDPNNLGRRFRRLVDRFAAAKPDLELPEGLGLHSLRHSFASNLVAGGVNLAIAAAAMRHSSVRTTGDVYGHLVPSTVSEAVRTLGAKVGR